MSVLPPPVCVSDVELGFAGTAILRNASFELGANRVIALLGSNGAGKTSLMRAILGLVPVRRGMISVFGTQTRKGRHDIGYMPQFRAITAPALSGRAFVASAFMGERWGFSLRRTGTDREVDRVLDLVGAAHMASRPIGLLSGGERQRLLLAQALLGEPKLLLLDEPLASLDPGRVAEVMQLIGALQRALGLTVLLSAHDINPLLGVADEVLYLAGGTACVGTVDEVITSASLSALYGTPIDVIRAQGRIFVMTAQGDAPSVAIGGDCCAHGHTSRSVGS